MTILARFTTLGEAESARSALDAAGIDAALADEEIVAVNWTYSNAVGGIKLVVGDEQHEEAAAVLASAASGDWENVEVEEPRTDEEPEPRGDEVPAGCPSCGSTDLARIPRGKLFVFFGLVALGAGYAAGRFDLALAAVAGVALVAALAPAVRCRNCGERWSPEPTADESRDAPPPELSDTVDSHCPRCGSAEVHHLGYRRLKAIPLLLAFTIVLVLPLWLVLPKWKCDQCGLRMWLPAR